MKESTTYVVFGNFINGTFIIKEGQNAFYQSRSRENGPGDQGKTD